MRKYKFYVFVILIFWGAGVECGAQTVFKLLNMNVRLSGEMVGYDAVPFADYIKEYDPDFVTLQEVDFKTARNGSKDFTTELAAELGYFSAFGKAIDYQQGEYGVAILSKFPIEKISNTQLTGNPAEMKEQRTVLYVEVKDPESKQRLGIAATHLDHSTEEVRASMIRQLKSAVSSKIPVLLAGDFNAHPSSPTIAVEMTDWQRICNNFATFPSGTPKSKIDYIFGKPAGEWVVENYTVLTNTADLTDHCAMFTEIRLNELQE